MPILFFQLHFHFANSYVCVSKHFYAVPSSPALINIYRHMNTFGLYSVLYFLSAFFENLIETYVTVPIDTLITLLISLSSAFFCIYNFQFIRMCASTCIRIFPSSIFIYIYRHIHMYISSDCNSPRKLCSKYANYHKSRCTCSYRLVPCSRVDVYTMRGNKIRIT